MPTKKSLALSRSKDSEDSDGLLDAERATLPFSAESAQTPALDTESAAEYFHLLRCRAGIAGDVSRVDAGRAPVIHNSFWIAGKVPSLNDLLEARGAMAPTVRSIIMRQKPGKAKSRGHRFDLYNDIKQDWKRRTVAAIGTPFVRVQSCYFGYVIVEETLKRDPSNVSSAAIKFIEDGLVEAGVIPNDGWFNVLGIRTAPIHRPGRDAGVYVVMSSEPMEEAHLVLEYEEAHLVLEYEEAFGSQL